MPKNFILDTCVLIHDPSCVFNFGEHNVFIPLEVIKELDRIKAESSERGQAARAAQRTLLNYLPNEPGKSKPFPERAGSIGTLMPPNGIFSTSSVMETLGDPNSSDHKIIATAHWFQETKKGNKVTLVTKDMGMAIKARLCGVHIEDYKHDKIETEESPLLKIQISTEEMDQFTEERFLEIEPERLAELPDLAINSYGLFISDKKPAFRYTGFGRFVAVSPGRIEIPGGIVLRAKNPEQLFFLDALLNPDIHLVTASGPAGTGKTLLAMAAALQQIGNGTYTGISISKAIESVGRANGFLPGSIEEKMRPWLQPYADALNFLHRKEEKNDTGKRQSQRKQLSKSQPAHPVGKTPYDALTETGVVEITAIEHIRGRSIPKRFLIVDECQNIPLGIVKTITTRLAEGSKIVYLGDPEQIDNPNLDRYSSGLSHLRSKMKNLANAAHVQLNKGERSLLAEQAAKML